ncbi:hypothetical protein K493DRAFT_319802 [Basidiobolus meristosporus CBS 931.73]|uniref:Uncharacterized protein n=1 Tax=Basidiobolus meristosporus CBS 931.73 TaxID=1314790 RepID=A0A1Y1XKV9_9FUNG|nr:hypothetical protein K493DRAFT_319802 [Basidiobolus meristosporus CBS 931.73]|eukprot:ORX86391.1 hypothetical protein K493DRAFT_319802 [Basidiobolus meristosporus CBS 931.73]
MSLIDMFSLNVAEATGYPRIIPNTKRWTEVRILAEAIHLKVVRSVRLLVSAIALVVDQLQYP